MNNRDRDQEEKVKVFMRVTGLSENFAIQALTASNWLLGRAINSTHIQLQIRSTYTRHLEELYNRYKDPNRDMILVHGITLLCNDLKVYPQDIVMLVVSWHMKAATMCEFSKQEFIGGLQSLGIYSLEKFRDSIPVMCSELRNERVTT